MIPIIFWAVGALLLTGCLSEKREREERERCGECHQDPNRPLDGFKCLFGRDDERCDSLKKFIDRHTIGAIRITQPIFCNDCHTIWDRVTDPRHIDNNPGSDVNFFLGSRATQRQINPSYDITSKTCKVACHGLNLPGGAQSSPPWSQVSDENQNCKDICHTLPPAAPHPQHVTLADCHSCHTETVATDGTIARPDLHINGQIDVKQGDLCTFCHGQPPPPSPFGTNQERQNQIGAHQTHLVGQPLSTNITCASCHTVPQTFDSPAHVDGDGRAEIVFGGLALSGQAQPIYDSTVQSCSRVYCHGATLSGGTLTTPTWNDTSRSPMACNACHGTPPEPPHMQNLGIGDCHLCHTETVTAEGLIARRDLHVNGRVDVRSDICTVCHGQPPQPPEALNHPNRTDCWTCHPDVAEGLPGERPIITNDTQHKNGTIDLFPPPQICNTCHGEPPPPSPFGTDEERRDQIGAHTAHLVEQPLSSNVTCETCHIVPEGVFDPAHRDGDGRTEITFGGLAIANGVTANYDPLNRSCLVYCHGVTQSGGQLTEPVWSDTTGSPASCNSCHGVPPPPPHLQNLSLTDCYRCHDQTVSPDGSIARRDLHVNGRVDVIEDICVACHDQPPSAPDFPNHPDRNDCWTCHSTVGPGGPGERPVIIDPEGHNNGVIDFVAPPAICTTCHGSVENGPAPPPDTQGNVDRESRTVGAHQQHLHNNLTSHVECRSCHPVPESVLAPRHRDGTRDIEFGNGMGVLSGVSANYDPINQTCHVYCHGVTLPGGYLNEPAWTDTSGNPAHCDSCHGFPPTTTGSHLPEDTDCYNCHSSVNQLSDGTWVILDPSKHMNGEVDLN